MKAERLTNRTKSLVNLLASGFLIVIVALCLISSSLFINTESLITLLVFDFLFLTLTFRLWGTLIGKLGLLALGNAVGLFCNLVFYSIHIVGVAFFGDGFNVFYAISYPY
jgi:hypothetical protein